MSRHGRTGGTGATVEQGFYNGRFEKPAVYVLERDRRPDGEDSAGVYLLREQIGYVAGDGRRWVVPGSPGATFRTDLASVPALAAWLVPKDGSHTPAAIVHDAMVLEAGETASYAPADPPVAREDADRIFREGMQVLGVRLLRRWLMWTAVSVPTFFGAHGHYWVRRLMMVPLGLFVVIGVVGVPDVFDVPGEVTLPSVLPWDGVVGWQLFGVEESPSPLQELGRFLAVAAGCTALYTCLWAGRRWRFGLVSGAALSLLAFPIGVTIVPYVLYRVAEELIAFALLRLRRSGRYRGRIRSSELVEKVAGG